MNALNFCNILEYCFNFLNTHMVPQKKLRTFNLLKIKSKEKKKCDNV